jgi:GntR family transcriptional regulator/MocR family aminotransferase
MLIALDPAATTPLHRQIYAAMRAAILEGRLAASARLPPSRVLADDLGVSRTTVLGAYDQLAAEGYITGRAGGGTRVASSVPRPTGAPRPKDAGARSAPDEISALGRRMVEAIRPWRADVPLGAFAYGVPAVDDFPLATWTRLTARRWRRTPRELLLTDDGRGYAPLREAVAQYSLSSRGVLCSK